MQPAHTVLAGYQVTLGTVQVPTGSLGWLSWVTGHLRAATWGKVHLPSVHHHTADLSTLPTLGKVLSYPTPDVSCLSRPSSLGSNRSIVTRSDGANAVVAPAKNDHTPLPSRDHKGDLA